MSNLAFLAFDSDREKKDGELKNQAGTIRITESLMLLFPPDLGETQHHEYAEVTSTF